MVQKKYTVEEIKKHVEENSNCTFVETHMEKTKHGSKRILSLICECGVAFDAQWNKFNRKDGIPQRRCKKCSLKERGKKQMMTDEEYTSRKEKAGISIQHLEVPKGRGNGIRHICPECGDRNWKPTPANVLAGKSTKCKKCSTDSVGGYNKKPLEAYLEVLRSKGILLKDRNSYKDTSTPALHICPRCGDDWLVRPNAILCREKPMCEPCSYILRGESRTYSIEEVERTISQNSCKWIDGEYTGIKGKLTYRCECGEPFERIFADFKRGMNRCRKCTFAISKGEYFIMNEFEKESIEFVFQQKFKDLRGKRKMPLSYDFGIYKDTQLIALLECDGRQHFEPVTFGKITLEQAEENLKCVQQRDARKEQYAKEKGIPLYRIKDTELEKIQDILKLLF